MPVLLQRRIWLLRHGWCTTRNCCHFDAKFSIWYTIQRPCTSLQCHFIQCYIDRVQVCWTATDLPPALLPADCPGSFTCYCGNTGVERIRNKSAQKVDKGEENSPVVFAAGTQTRDLSITTESDALTAELPAQHSIMIWFYPLGLLTRRCALQFVHDSLIVYTDQGLSQRRVVWRRTEWAKRGEC